MSLPKNLKPGGIDIAWKNGPSGICIFGDRPQFFLLSPSQLLSFSLPNGLYLIDAPLTLPGSSGLREVDRLLRKVTGIPALPLKPSLFSRYLPLEFLQTQRGSIFLEGFVPYLRVKFLGRAKFRDIAKYRERFRDVFGFLPSPPSPHLLDAYLLCLRAGEILKGRGIALVAPDGEVFI